MTQEEMAQWIIDNVRMKFLYTENASEEVFNNQNKKAVEWITNKFELVRKTQKSELPSPPKP